MMSLVNDWSQAGHVYVWRYRHRLEKDFAWNLSADTAGCASLVDLLDRMRVGAIACHRTIALTDVPEAVSDVPIREKPAGDRPETIKLFYDPEQADFLLRREDGRLVLHLGESRFDEFRAALVDVSIGLGDYALSPREKGAGWPLWFWWMPRGFNHRTTRTT